jgi:hypothetical protein
MIILKIVAAFAAIGLLFWSLCRGGGHPVYCWKCGRKPVSALGLTCRRCAAEIRAERLLRMQRIGRQAIDSTTGTYVTLTKRGAK